MSGMIFISYRRGDDPGSTGRLFERLQVEGFSSDQLFMDIDSIAPGIDFLRELHRQVEQSDVMLAVIGKGWIDARDATGAGVSTTRTILSASRSKPRSSRTSASFRC